MQQDALVRIRMDNSGLQGSADQAARSFEKVGAAGQVSARQTAAAFRQLPAQLTDITTQLAGGQNPLLILLQQGGQIKDSFGGIGNAARALASAISPMTLVLGGVGVALAGVGAAAVQGALEQRELQNALALTGNAAGLTSARLDAVAASVEANSQQTIGSSRAIVVELARQGTVSNGVLAEMATAVARVADVTGQDATKVAADFATMGNGVAAWAAQHNKAWNFITVEQYRYIKRLEEQGKAEEAARVVNGLLVKSLEGQRQQLGLLESAYDSTLKAASGFWDFLKGIGREQTTRQQLDQAIERLTSLGGNLGPRAKEAAEQRVQFLKEQLRLENQQADVRSRNAAANRAAIADEIRNAGKKPEPLGAIRDGRAQQRNDFLRSEKDVYRQLAEEEKKLREESAKDPLGSFIDDQLNAQKRRDEKRLEQNADFLQDLVDGNARTSAQLIQGEQARGEALIELDRQLMMRRLEQLGIDGDARAEAERLIGERAELARTELLRGLADGGKEGARQTGRELYDDVRQSLSDAFRDSKDPVRAFVEGLANTLYTRVTARLADALATAAVGKDGTGGWLGQLLGMVTYSGSSTNPSAGNYENSFDLMNSAPPMATGTNYVPRDMLAFLHRGEEVVPRQYNPAAGGLGRGGGINQALNIRIDSRADQQQVAANVREAVSEGNRQLLEEMRAKGLIP